MTRLTPADLVGIATSAHTPNAPAVLTIGWDQPGLPPGTEPMATYFQESNEFDHEYRQAVAAVVGHRPPPARVLDVGCGPGRFVRHFARLGYDVTGVDLSAECARIANAAVPGSARRFDLWHMTPGEFGTFDVILLFGHNLGLGGTPDGVHRLLRLLGTLADTGAVLAVNSIDKPAGPSLIAAAQVRHSRRLGRYDGQVRCTLHWNGYSSTEFEWVHVSPVDFSDWAAACGWGDIATFRRPLLPAFWSACCRKSSPEGEASWPSSPAS